MEKKSKKSNKQFKKHLREREEKRRLEMPVEDLVYSLFNDEAYLLKTLWEGYKFPKKPSHEVLMSLKNKFLIVPIAKGPYWKVTDRFTHVAGSNLQDKIFRLETEKAERQMGIRRWGSEGYRKRQEAKLKRQKRGEA